MINEMQNGRIYTHDSPDDFSNSLMDMIKSDNLSMLGKNGVKWVMDKYNWDNSSKALIDLYEGLG